MAYAKELDQLRQELRQGVAGTLVFWPKIAGTGNVAASATASHNTFVVKDSSGNTVQASANATRTTVGSISRLDLSVSALSTLDEDYRAEITWRESGGSVDYFDVVFFDVVLWPWGPPSVSLNDLQEERADAEEICTRHGLKLAITAAEMAAIYGVRARVELDRMVRDQVVTDSGLYPQSGHVSVPGVPARGRPHLILNRERLNLVERKLAVRCMFEADMTDPEPGSGDESGALYAHYKAAAESAWRSVGPLKYDAGQSLSVTVEDAIKPSSQLVTRRPW